MAKYVCMACGYKGNVFCVHTAGGYWKSLTIKEKLAYIRFKVFGT